ncbi:MAG: phosphocholine cytidylyltransferase family protein [Alphaproteobacteria bacterium]|nr:phosphocholine cytidylyltransferase family protein [Alphaproteobacteria bacterium]
MIIGAGRGIRLMPMTANGPKCFAEIRGRRILDWILAALQGGGVDDICFVGGYRIDDVRRHYPHFTFRHNADWPNNNILASLMYAEDLMDRPFITTYSDILYTPEIVRALASSQDDIALGVDTDWRTHYAPRTQHPPHDAEKLILRDGRVLRVHRGIPYEEASGEFIGVAKFSTDGARQLREHYHRRRREFAGKPFREAQVFEKSYLIHLFQDMIEAGIAFGHADTHGRYREIDTQEDLHLAERGWEG